MRVIELSLQQVDNETTATVRVCVEEKRGHGYARMSAVDITSKTPEAQRRILLGDNDRIVVEPIAVNEIVYDRDQMMATTRPVGSDVPTAEKKPGVTGPNVTKAPTVAPVSPKIPVHQAVNSPKPTPTSAVQPKPTSPMGQATQKPDDNSEQKSSANPEGKSVDGMKSSTDVKASEK